MLPMIDILAAGRARARMPRTLILEPTRELAAQVAESFDKYGKYQKLTKALLIGGVSFGDQDALLARGVDVLIATPGRLLDHFERGKLLLTGVQVMVVDEADRMLDMGFIPDIERIFKLTPFTRQTLFFSATMPPEITRLTQAVPAQPQAHRSGQARNGGGDDRPARRHAAGRRSAHAPRRAARGDDAASTCSNGIIFCNRKTDVDVVAQSLEAPRLQRLADPRRSRPIAAHQDARPLPLRRAAVPDRVATSPRAGSTSRTSATSSTTSRRVTPTTTSTASAAPAAPASKAPRSRWSRRTTARASRRSKNSRQDDRKSDDRGRARSGHRRSARQRRPRPPRRRVEAASIRAASAARSSTS